MSFKNKYYDHAINSEIIEQLEKITEKNGFLYRGNGFISERIKETKSSTFAIDLIYNTIYPLFIFYYSFIYILDLVLILLMYTIMYTILFTLMACVMIEFCLLPLSIGLGVSVILATARNIFWNIPLPEEYLDMLVFSIRPAFLFLFCSLLVPVSETLKSFESFVESFYPNVFPKSELKSIIIWKEEGQKKTKIYKLLLFGKTIWEEEKRIYSNESIPDECLQLQNRLKSYET